LFYAKPCIICGYSDGVLCVVGVCVSVPVEIVEPMSRDKRVVAGSVVVLICKADVRTAIRWYLNSTQPLDNDVSSGIYVISAVDRTGGVATSQLQLVHVRLQNSGRYSCRSQQDASDNDAVVLTVRDNQQGTSFTRPALLIIPRDYDIVLLTLCLLRSACLSVAFVHCVATAEDSSSCYGMPIGNRTRAFE